MRPLAQAEGPRSGVRELHALDAFELQIDRLPGIAGVFAGKEVPTLQPHVHAAGLLVVDDVPYGAQGKVRWVYSLAGDVSPGTLAKVAGNGASGKGKADER